MIAGMKALRRRLPALTETCVGDVGHGEIMFEQPERYAENIAGAIGISQP